MHKCVVVNNVKRLAVALYALESKPKGLTVELSFEERAMIEVAIEMAMTLLEKEIEN